MPSPSNNDDEQYISSQDSDFAPDDGPAHGSDASDSDEEPRRQEDGSSKRRRRSEAEDGYNNSGDEAVIQKGRKRQKRAANKGDDLYDGGEGGLIKTRRQRAEEKAERQHDATIGPVTVDVDALWEQMTSGKPIPTKDEQPAKDDRPDDSADGHDDTVTKRESDDPSNPPDTLVIKRTYNFAGRIHTEEKVVPRDSAEGRLHLSTLTPQEAAAAAAAAGTETEGAKPQHQPRKAFRSAFEPMLDNALASSPRTDLDLGLAARRQAAQEAQAKKLNTVEKSRMDWAGYVDREGIQDELALASKSKDSYNARQAFLARSEAIRDDEEMTGEISAEEVFRRHFEACFQPLPTKTTTTTATSAAQNTDEDADAGGQDEWAGFSDEPSEDERDAIEVVDHSNDTLPPLPKPPVHTTKPSGAAQSKLPEDAPSLVAQDLALRRLLSESRLLHRAKTRSQSETEKLFSAGRARLEAMNMRLSGNVNDVGADGDGEGVKAQKKMPMKMRKGIEAAKEAREAKRQKQARENGILLEKKRSKTPSSSSSRKEMMMKKKSSSRGGGRGRGRDPNEVGTFRRGELRLSQRDVDSIQRSRDVFGRR
ncbi:hypothetical protein CP532_3856 [Ophiocordyceps camponoti-leonardi (nom. inval.)]|nr:hypothetical protein CP532_3856 [Ophiocordyceps camponoti-leonardi (nom. inval.)]